MDATDKPETCTQVAEVQPGTPGFQTVLALAAHVLAQDRYLTSAFPAAQESHVLALRRCRIAGCYQMRSRSPVTSVENYALKLASGYVLHPSQENDSYYFILLL